MTSQSGIGASQELRDAFSAARTNKDKRFFKVQIIDEALVSVADFDGSDNDEEDFAALMDMLPEDKSPCYFVFRMNDASPMGEDWVLVAYIPDGSKVRDRMLYASTRFNVKKELGLGCFVGDMYGTEPSDMDWATLQDALKKKTSLSHQEAEREVVRSDTEKQLRTDDREIMRDADSTGRTHSIAFPFNEEALSMMEQLKNGEVQLVQLKVDLGQEVVEGVSADAVSDYGALGSMIDAENPRFYFIDFKHNFEEQDMSSIISLYFCPDCAPVKERMVMSTIKAKVLESSGVDAAKSIECRDIEDLTEKYLFEELHPPPKEEKKLFARPKTAGKGGRRLIRRTPTPSE